MTYQDEVASGRRVAERILAEELQLVGFIVASARWIDTNGFADYHILAWERNGRSERWRISESHLADVVATPGIENALRGQVKELLRAAR